MGDLRMLVCPTTCIAIAALKAICCGWHSLWLKYATCAETNAAKLLDTGMCSSTSDDSCRFLEGAEVDLNKTFVRSAIQQSLREVFGVIGGAINFDVLEVREESKQAFLKVDRRYV